VNGPVRLPNWDSLEASIPAVAATMRRYLDQLACVLRPGSVGGADLALRSLAAFLIEQAPHVASIGDVGRHEIEGFVRWLAVRPGRTTVRVTPATLAHRLGTLRMFFVRISEGTGPTRRPGCRSSPATYPARTVRCRRRSTTPPPRSSTAPPTTSRGC